MSSHDSPSNETPGSNGEPVWHPAQEWPEEDDELDMTYHPALDGAADDLGPRSAIDYDDESSGSYGNEAAWAEAEAMDEEMGINVSDGEATLDTND